MTEQSRLKLLYLDDEPMNLDGFYYSFNDSFDIHRAQTPTEAFNILEKYTIKVIITDQRMPEMSGTEFIKKVKAVDNTLLFIIVTGYSDMDILSKAVNQLKIYGLVQKPYNEHEMRILIKNAFDTYALQQNNKKLIGQLKEKNHELTVLHKKLENENIILKQEIKNNTPTNIITQNKALKKLLLKIEQAAASDAPVLIQGETGTGKELIAKAVHSMSLRNKTPLITVNCAALPESLIESELFGYEKGAFTGASKQKPGRFEIANNGTLFLDEIGELPLHTQPKLLRVLQEGTFERLGGTKTIKTNVRIITATNRNLKAEIQNKKFREDLYFRLNMFEFNIPALRNRTDDISLLVNFFIQKYNAKYRKQVTIIPKETIRQLEASQWPGNIRELENLIERAIITSPENTLVIDSLHLHYETILHDPLRLIDVEKFHIEQILNKTNWRIRGKNGAAEILDVKPTTLHSKIKKLDIKKRE